MSVLIVCRPDPLADALQAVLSSMPEVEDAYLVDTARKAIRALAELRSSLVILDYGLPNRQAPGLLRQLKAGSPCTRCMVLADSVAEGRAAEGAGADAALLKGCPAAALIATVERLLA